MARAARHSALESRTARARLKVQKEPHWGKVRPGLFVGYYKGSHSGAWWVRRYAGSQTYQKAVIGAADDTQDANGVDVLDYFQAQKKAMQWADAAVQEQHGRNGRLSPCTVGEAVSHYLRWFEVHKKSVDTTRKTIETFILPAFGDRRIEDLTKNAIEKWRDKLASTPPRKRTKTGMSQPAFREPGDDPDALRRRRATANRVFTVLRAILNKAFADNLVVSDRAWRQVKPFRGVDEPRIRIPTTSECTRLANAAPPELARLIRGALMTGGRFGELQAMRVADYSTDDGRIYFPITKGGRPRYVPLNASGRALFDELTAGRGSDAIVFVQDDGSAWRKNGYVRALAVANKIAKISPPLRFHELRHAYASALINAGTPVEIIAKLLGHADTRITLRHYAHLTDATLKLAVKNLPAFGQSASKVHHLRASTGKTT